MGDRDHVGRDQMGFETRLVRDQDRSLGDQERSQLATEDVTGLFGFNTYYTPADGHERPPLTGVFFCFLIDCK